VLVELGPVELGASSFWLFPATPAAVHPVLAGLPFWPFIVDVPSVEGVPFVEGVVEEVPLLVLVKLPLPLLPRLLELEPALLPPGLAAGLAPLDPPLAAAAPPLAPPAPAAKATAVPAVSAAAARMAMYL